MKITFYGAAGGVTGSKHMVEADGRRVLFDCGVWQGPSEKTREKNSCLPFSSHLPEAVILSHAHIDHCGLLPLLVKEGYEGLIYATAATRDVTKLMLEDMAEIEMQDAAYRRRHNLGSPRERQPLFVVKDVARAMERFAEVPYARHGSGWRDIAAGARLKFYDAGHILGSAACLLEIKEGRKTKRLLFSGDLGPRGLPLLHDPQAPEEEVEVLLLESTYGSRVHEASEGAEDRLALNIKTVLDRGGKMIVPAFSLGRTQGIVYLLHKLFDEGKLPRFPVYVDSPLAVDLTEVYGRHRREYDKESRTDFKSPDDKPLKFSNLKYIRSQEESKKLNDKEDPFMVISASGMMSYGRVVHHLRQHISKPQSAIFVTGYQAEGTLGRQIVEGESEVEIFGDRLPVRAQVFMFNEFSAHADRNQLQQYAEKIKGLKDVFLVHGEPHQADDLKAQLEQAHASWRVERPEEGMSYTV